MLLCITATNSFSRTSTSLLRSKLRKMFDWSPAVSSSSSWQGSSSLLLLLPLLEKEKIEVVEELNRFTQDYAPSKSVIYIFCKIQKQIFFLLQYSIYCIKFDMVHQIGFENQYSETWLDSGII